MWSFKDSGWPWLWQLPYLPAFQGDSGICPTRRSHSRVWLVPLLFTLHWVHWVGATFPCEQWLCHIHLHIHMSSRVLGTLQPAHQHQGHPQVPTMPTPAVYNPCLIFFLILATIQHLHFTYLFGFISGPALGRPPGRQEFSTCSPFYLWHLEQCLAWNSCSINICQMETKYSEAFPLRATGLVLGALSVLTTLAAYENRAAKALCALSVPADFS